MRNYRSKLKVGRVLTKSRPSNFPFLSAGLAAVDLLSSAEYGC